MMKKEWSDGLKRLLVIDKKHLQLPIECFIRSILHVHFHVHNKNNKNNKIIKKKHYFVCIRFRLRFFCRPAFMYSFKPLIESNASN